LAITALKVADEISPGIFSQLNFYKYESNVKSLVTAFKESINEFAAGMTEEERAESLKETPETFVV